MHSPINLHHNPVPLPQEPTQKPLHQSMTPIRCARKSHVLRTSTPSQLAQHSCDKLPRIRHQSGALADLRHGRGNEVRLDALYVHAVGLQFGAQSGRPLLEEGFAAGVGGKEGCGKEATEGRHGKDKAALAGDHARCNDLCDPQRSHAIYHDNIVHFLGRCFDKRNRNAMTQSHIINQDGDVEAVDELAQAGVVGILVLREIHCERFGGDFGAMLGGDFGCEGVKFGLGARNEEEIVAFCGESEGELFADAVAGASYEGPGATGSESGELGKC